jgi:UDPglucose 6-dehydrogenase
MVITIIGAGYVGLTQAAIFANAGFKVFALDTNSERVSIIQSGRSFFHEQHLDPLIAHAVKTGNLVATTSYETALKDAEIIFSCVGTPDKEDGSSDLSYVYSAVEMVSDIVKDRHAVFVQKSTVPVGTGAVIESMFYDANVPITYVANPEFLREGTAVADSLWFDRVVVGGSDNEAIQSIIDLYKTVTDRRDDIANIAGIKKRDSYNDSGEYVRTSVNSAELIKVAANAFLSTKISFANSIAKLADATGADVVEVMNGVGADPRIGRAFLNAGRGFGGGCFPKDVSSLISSGSAFGVELDIIRSVKAENDSMPQYILDKVVKNMTGDLKDKNVTVLGLSYKAGTSDTRRSPSVRIANLLSESGAAVRVYDPVVTSNHLLDDELKRYYVYGRCKSCAA